MAEFCILTINDNAERVGEDACGSYRLAGMDYCFYHEMKSLVEVLEAQIGWKFSVKIPIYAPRESIRYREDEGPVPYMR